MKTADGEHGFRFQLIVNGKSNINYKKQRTTSEDMTRLGCLKLIVTIAEERNFYMYM